MKTERDPNFYLTHSPIEFLTFMEDYARRNKEILSVIIPIAPDNWVRKEHIPDLLNLVRDQKRIQGIISSTRGSNAPLEANHSSIGAEAQNLIESYRTGRPYPDFDFSFGRPDENKAEELEKWWAEFGQQ
jgi:hypothetical protein